MRLTNTVRALLLFLALPFMAAAAQDRVTVSAENAKLYQQPSLSAPGTAVARGSVLTVLERTGDWISVFDGKRQGFVHRALVAGAPQAEAPAVAAYPQAAPAPVYSAPAAAYPAPAPAYPAQAQAYPAQAPGYPAAVPPAGTYAKPGQVRFAGQPGYKDPTIARVLGLFIPGGEGFYTGNMTRGLVKAGIGYGGLIVLPMLFAKNTVDNCYNDVYSGNYDSSSCDGSSMAWVALAGYGTYVATVLHGVITGGDVADAANRRPTYAVSPMIQPGANGRTLAGLSISIPTLSGR